MRARLIKSEAPLKSCLLTLRALLDLKLNPNKEICHAVCQH